MNWSPMSMNAIRGPRPRMPKSKRRPYRSSAASRSPTSSATWLMPTSRPLSPIAATLSACPLAGQGPKRNSTPGRECGRVPPALRRPLAAALAAAAVVALAVAAGARLGAPALALAGPAPAPPPRPAPAAGPAALGRRRPTPPLGPPQRLSRQAALPGLGTGLLPAERPHYEMLPPARHERPLAAFALDLDGFKAV